MQQNRADKELRLNVAVKKEVLKSVAHERSMLIKHCSEWGYRKRYNAVVLNDAKPINSNEAMLTKMCNKHYDMHIIKNGKQFTMYVNDEPMLVIKKHTRSRQQGSRWVIEQYSNDKKHKSVFQHGYVFILRVPTMPVRMGVFFKAPIDQDFTNFTNHFRSQDYQNIVNFSLTLLPMAEPTCGFKYHKLSNNFDLSKIFNDLAPNDSMTKLTPCHDSKKNFALHKVHQLYKPKKPLMNDGKGKDCQDGQDCQDGKDKDGKGKDGKDGIHGKDGKDGNDDKDGHDGNDYSLTLDSFYYSKTDASSKPYVAMTRYQQNFYLTTYNNPATPAIAFITSVLACTV